MVETFTARDGYDRSKSPRQLTFRRMTVEEAKQLRYGQTVKFLAIDGTVRNVKVNGAPKVWKRSPERVSVPVKYGLYEYATITERGDGTVESLIVVEG